MARTNVDAQTPTRAGLTPVFTPAIADGHMTPNNGRIFLRFKNTTASPVVVTVKGFDYDGQVSPGRTISVPATTGDVTSPHWPPTGYNQSDGRIWWDYATTTGMSVAVIELPPV